MHTAGFRRLLQRLALHCENLGFGQRNNIRASSLPALADNGHFAKAVAGSQQVENSAVLDNLEFAFREETEEITWISIMQYWFVRGNAAPMRKSQHFPYLGIGEIGKEWQITQSVEFF